MSLLRLSAALSLFLAAPTLAETPPCAPVHQTTDARSLRTIEEQLFWSLPEAYQGHIQADLAWPVEWANQLADVRRQRVAAVVGPQHFARLRPEHQSMLVRGYSPLADRRELPSVCFAPGTPPEVMEAFHTAIFGVDDGLRYNTLNRWSSTATNGGGLSQGMPTTITYSFVPDGTFISNSSLGISGGSTLISYLNGIYGSESNWRPLFDQVFDRWSQLAGLTYVWEPNDDGVSLGNNSGVLGVRGDVRIGGIAIDGGSGILAYNSFPNNGDMVIDTSDSFYFNTSNNSRRLRNVVAHEHGHGIGLLHVCPVLQTKLMEPYVSTAYDGPRHDDIRAAQFLYGDAHEPDNSPAQAFSIGELTSNTTITLGETPPPTISQGATLSIDANGEVDWYRFALSSGMSLSFTVSPIGTTYDDSEQACSSNPDGSRCCSGNFTNSAAAQNLELRVYDTDASTLLESASAAPAGSPETLSNLTILFPGDYYLRVGETGTTSNEAQLYKLEISAVSIDCNANGIVDECDLDCGAPGCSVPGCGQSLDCDVNGLPEECDLASGIANDCNVNGVPDTCDVDDETSPDCNNNGVPDECELVGNDCNANSQPDDCDVAALAPSVTPPADAFVCIDAIATFEVDAPGATDYRWLRDGIVLQSGEQRFFGIDSSTLVIDPVTADDHLTTYSCVVNFGCLEYTTPPALARLAPAAIDLTLLTAAQRSVCTGSNVIVHEVAVDDTTGISYQWSKDGVDLVDDARISGADTARLEVADVVAEDMGVYTCRVTNPCVPPETEISVSAVVDLLDPQFLVEPADACVETGGTAQFSADVVADASTVYRWYEDTTLLTDGGRYSGTGTPNLMIADVQPEDDGRQFLLAAIVPDPTCFTVSRTATLFTAEPGGCPAPCVTPGDFDGDGDLDLLDAYSFMRCMDADILEDTECTCANLWDRDFAVDLLDWSEFEAAWTGPQ